MSLIVTFIIPYSCTKITRLKTTLARRYTRRGFICRFRHGVNRQKSSFSDILSPEPEWIPFSEPNSQSMIGDWLPCSVYFNVRPLIHIRLDSPLVTIIRKHEIVHCVVPRQCILRIFRRRIWLFTKCLASLLIGSRWSFLFVLLIWDVGRIRMALKISKLEYNMFSWNWLGCSFSHYTSFSKTRIAYTHEISMRTYQ